jgi:WD40-like Beta Propeller Repeat
MTSAMPDATDRFIVAWLAEGPDRGPADLLERAFVSARATRQRPGWTIPGWWVPEAAIDPRAKRLAILVAIALLLAAIVALAVSGSFRATRRPFTDPILLRGPLDGELALFAVDTTGAGPKRVAPAQGWPEVSPDGRHVLFDSNTSKIGIARTDGSGFRTFPDPGAPGPGGGQWSPDSTSVAWDSVTDAGSPYLAIATPDSDVVRRIDVPRVQPFGEPIGEVGYAWSPDNRHVVLYAADMSTECASDALHVVDINSGAVQRIELPGNLWARPSWSTDGGRLAVMYADPGSASPSCQPASWSLTVVDMATMATRTMVDRSTAELGGLVYWASGDRALVYDERTGDGALTIQSMPIDGGQATELATIGAVNAIWSPDRRSIAWSDASTLWTMDIDRPVPRPIASSVESRFGIQPSWSRDGRWIAFSRGPIDERKGTGSLWLVRPDGTDETLVSKDEGLDYRSIFW